MTGASPLFTLEIDVGPLKETCAFYETLLGFRVAHVKRAGLITESRTLVCDDFPGVRLVLHSCAPRPPMGSAVGTIRTITFHVKDPAATAARLANPTWIVRPPADAPADLIVLQDSSGYHVALARSPEGSACSDASPPGRTATSSPAASS